MNQTNHKPGNADAQPAEEWWSLTLRPMAGLLPGSVRVRQLIALAKSYGLETMEARQLPPDLSPPVEAGIGGEQRGGR